MLHFMNATGRFRVLMIALIAVGSLSLTACKSETNYFATDSASSGDGGTGDTPTAATGMRLRLKPKAGVDAFMHRFGDIAAGCEIPVANKDTPTSIRCLLNIMEYDVWFHGFSYELNIPAGFCEFIEEEPYYYWDEMAGAPPATAALTVRDGAITVCSADGELGTIAAGGGSCEVGEGVFSPNGGFKCDYDYTSANGIGENCCEGSTLLTLTTETTTINPPPAPATITTVVTGPRIEQQGKVTNCISSPHSYIENWPKVAATGLAATIVLELGGNQLTRTQQIPSPFKVYNEGKRHSSNAVVFNAGMHGWSTYATNPSTWAATRQIPRGLRPIRDKGPLGNWTPVGMLDTNLPGFDGSYEFRCLGPAGELKHRIRLYVNEWNTIEDYLDFKTNGDPTAVDPSRKGLAGVDCSAVNLGQTCNSFWGFQDIIDDPEGANGVATLWYFPMEWRRGAPD